MNEETLDGTLSDAVGERMATSARWQCHVVCSHPHGAKFTNCFDIACVSLSIGNNFVD